MVKSMTPAPTPAPAGRPAEYTVVARRYRPQQFADLIGQEHVAQALVNALESGRVAHAYLFTGARGVGKTSAARILAKALNCVAGPTATPCDACDSCVSVAVGQDMDVLEIDGASNNKVEEVRDLRANVSQKTHARYKIYIIDEVHMLTTQAFNALLKTLEEPPPHVKFIFATTEVQKIPVTILSRCQRFDFANVGPAKIFDQLKRIVGREGHEADDDALRLVARRAAGSMRDSQSLLDQLLASGSGRLTADHVHAVLGSTGDERVLGLATAILAGDPKTALGLIAEWVERGLQLGELVDQLIEYWRALMLAGCGSDLRDLPLSPPAREAIQKQPGTVSLDTVLAGLEILTTTKARMRGSSHAQVLIEMAVVRLARIDELLSVTQLLNGSIAPAQTSRSPVVTSGSGTPADTHNNIADESKKNALKTPGNTANESLSVVGRDAGTVLSLTDATLPVVWQRLQHYLADKAPILASHVKSAQSTAIFGPNALVFRFTIDYHHSLEACSTELNVQRLQEALQKITGAPAVVRCELVGTAAAKGDTPLPGPVVNPAAERKRNLMGLPLFKKAADALGAQIWHVDDAFNPTAAPTKPVASLNPLDGTDPDRDPDEA